MQTPSENVHVYDYQAGMVDEVVNRAIKNHQVIWSESKCANKLQNKNNFDWKVFYSLKLKPFALWLQQQREHVGICSNNNKENIQ